MRIGKDTDRWHGASLGKPDCVWSALNDNGDNRGSSATPMHLIWPREFSLQLGAQGDLPTELVDLAIIHKKKEIMIAFKLTVVTSARVRYIHPI